MSVQPPSPAGNDFRLPVHQVDATKKRVHPRFVTGFYQNIRVVSMYFLLLLFWCYHGFAMADTKQYGSISRVLRLCYLG